MTKLARHAPLSAFTVGLALWAGTARVTNQQPPVPAAAMGAMDSTDGGVVQATHAAMAGSLGADAHVKLTPRRAGRAADSARAAALLSGMRRSLAKYRDVQVAEADGFRQFLPGVPQPIYHFTNWRWAREEMFRFDPTRPTALLYRPRTDGTFELMGAMYAAPARASLDELDRRVPLSITRWHQHINWCVPPRGARERWRDSMAGRPVFGPHSPIATAAACRVVGGRFLPRVFGWMVHVMAFAGDDPSVIWGGGHHSHS